MRPAWRVRIMRARPDPVPSVSIAFRTLRRNIFFTAARSLGVSKWSSSANSSVRSVIVAHDVYTRSGRCSGGHPRLNGPGTSIRITRLRSKSVRGNEIEVISHKSLKPGQQRRGAAPNAAHSDPAQRPGASFVVVLRQPVEATGSLAPSSDSARAFPAGIT